MNGWYSKQGNEQQNVKFRYVKKYQGVFPGREPVP